MKKQVHAKDKREAQKKDYSKVNAVKPVKEALIVDEVAEKKAPKKKTKKTNSKMAGLKSAFVLGDDKLVLTTFGKGNEAVVEKIVTQSSGITSVNTPESFSAEKIGSNFNINKYQNNENINGKPTDPRHKGKNANTVQAGRTAGMDMIGAKEALEKRCFGQSFDDNIHIQIAYSIMDIEKILAPHINNIYYELNNLLRNDDEGQDFWGYMNVGNTYETFLDIENVFKDKTRVLENELGKRNAFDKLMKSYQRAYLGSALYDKNTGVIEDIFDTEKRDELRRYYYELCLLGMSRQCLMHGQNIYRTALFTLDETFDNPDSSVVNARREARNILDQIYKKPIDNLNESFIKNSKNDIHVLFEIFGAFSEEEKAKLIKEYYDFVVRKPQKNTGFSIKRIRENMFFEGEGKSICDTLETGMKKKFYRNVDFMITKYYDENTLIGTNLIDSLRYFAKNEAAKEDIYINEGKRLWGILGKDIKGKIRPLMDSKEFLNLGKEYKVSSLGVKESLYKSHFVNDSAEYFSKLIYMFTLFLDGKEINDMLTQLLSKFENISAFVSVLQSQKLVSSFTFEYSMFEKCEKISEELRQINHIARQQKPEQVVVDVAYIEALQVLGLKETGEIMDLYKEYILCGTLEDDPGKTMSDLCSKAFDRITKGGCPAKYAPQEYNSSNTYEGHKQYLLKCGIEAGLSDEVNGQIADYIMRHDGSKKDMLRAKLFRANYTKLPNQGFRNFIINNVIKSSKFNYLVRYTNPAKISEIAHNRPLVKYALSQISDDQILRYYSTCFGDEGTLEMMRSELLRLVTNISFESFRDVNQKADAETDSEKRRYQQMIGLYLAVLYLIVKNIVYVNARYTLAFHCVERDYVLLLAGEGEDFKDNEKGWLALTNEFAEKRLNKRAAEYILSNIKNIKDSGFIVSYRNKIVHLNAIRNITNYASGIKNVESYYALYHYLVQREIFTETDKKGTLLLDKLKDNAPVKLYYKNLMEHGTYVKDFTKSLNTPFGYNLPRYKNLSVEGLFDRNRSGNPTLIEKTQKGNV